MLQRIVFILITLFWVTMNILLWRAEYGERTGVGSPVPVEMVWQKILNAPDDSSLNINRHGKRVGIFRLQTSVGEKLSKLEEAPRNGVNIQTSKIRFDGNLIRQERFRRLRFEGELSLSDDHRWQQFSLRLAHRPYVFEIHSQAAERIFHVRATDGEGFFERAFAFSEFQDPMALVSSLAGPLAEGLVSNLGLPDVTQPASQSGLSLNWEARTDTLFIGHEPVRVYRLQTQIADRYDIVVFVSHAGEILKVELPEDIMLLHQKLTSY